MKKYILSAFMFVGVCAFAQEDMSPVWESRLGHQIQSYGTGNESRGYSYAASDKEITLFDNKSGKVIYEKKFKDIAPQLRKIDEIIPLWESNAFIFFDKKMGKDQVVCVDMKSADILWSSERFQLSESFGSAFAGSQNETTSFAELFLDVPEEEGFLVTLKKEMVFVKARTGEEIWSTEKFKGVVGQYVYTDGHLIAVNFVPGGLGALFTGFKNQISKINLKNGEIVWEQNYVGRAERKVITKEFLFDLEVKGDIVVLRLNGIQNYDLKTGAKLWSAAFDYTADKIVGEPQGTKKFGVYGAVAEPDRKSVV